MDRSRADRQRRNWSRREFLAHAGLGAAAGAAGATVASAGACGRNEADRPWWRRGAGSDAWGRVRAAFRLDPDYIHLAGLLLASHPAPVAEAIAGYRRRLDENPALYLEDEGSRLEARTRRAAARYLGADANEIALTDSTTMGLGLVYNGVALRAGQELLTSRHDYYSTRASLRFKAARAGATLRYYQPFRDSATATPDEITETLAAAITPRTRVVAVTWVHSSTGLKIPLRQIADAVARLNAGRDEPERALLCVDAVHALGVEDFQAHDLGCDVLIAGTHKWLFGPRGTGIVWAHPRSHGAISPTIPTFTRGAGWGGRMSPGGFKPFEHQWALAEAFEFHRELGKANVARRIHSLTRQAIEALSAMRHVRVRTPADERLSAGIVCFDVDGLGPEQVVRRLRDRRIIASTTPYDPSHARIAPGLLNSPEEIEATLVAIRGLQR